jgi:Nitroreductase
MLDSTIDLEHPDVLERIFFEGRSFSVWQDKPIPEALLRQLFEMTIMGPTAANCLPLRIAFAASDSAKERLVPLMNEGNRRKTRTAPVTAILAMDLSFHTQLHTLFPHEPTAASWFTSSPAATREAALRNASLQCGYFVMAARALGMDCGPMGGFNGPAIAREFFPGRPYEVNLVCNLGYGVRESLHPRLPRLSFEEAAQIV